MEAIWRKFTARNKDYKPQKIIHYAQSMGFS